MPTIASKEVRLKSRPVGLPKASDFDLGTVQIAEPGPGEVQVKNLYMTVDPYMRGRMYDRPSYVPPFQIGEPLQGGAIGQVTASNDPKFAVGDIVNSMFGWREAYVAPASALQKVETHGLPPQAFLGVVGMPGMTAYVGLLKIAALKPGDVVFVSAAAGAVGAIVCQIANGEFWIIRGCDLTDRAALQGLADLDGRHIAGTVIHAATHIGINGHIKVLDLDLAGAGLCNLDRGQIKIRGLGQANRARFEPDFLGCDGGHGLLLDGRRSMRRGIQTPV